MQIILLLAILGGLTLLLVQNWSPVLPLVFLGLTTPVLPLALWILISLAAGAGTTIAIASLFNLANYFAQPKPTKKRQVTPPPRPQPSSNTYTRQPTTQESNNSADDWLEDPINDEDWQYEENIQDSQKAESYPQDPRSYEVNSEPKSSKRQGSVYSYSYREPENPEVRKTDSVYDADYRVLKPPYKSPNPVQDDDDDWGFDDEQDNLRSPRQ
ncbi:LapA family protein [Nostoc sp.]|uniref:LapA family protein n=1 Tax=Nostoc sp. TaxID=1180 RepID=UPI003593D474